jgi:Ulp1 protease family, C-terminal catalytic domain
MSVARIGDQVLYPEDQALIPAPHWWNDNLISFWIEGLRLRNALPAHVAILPPSLVFLACTAPSPTTLQEMLVSLSLVSKTLVLAPINSHFASYAAGEHAGAPVAVTGVHWSLLAYSAAEARFFHFDTFRHSPNLPAAALVASKLGAVVGVAEESPAVAAADVPPQSNGDDCGPHCCSIMEQLCDAGAKFYGASFSVDENLCASARDSMAELVASVLGGDCGGSSG